MNSIKCLVLGMALGSIATIMIASNCKMTNCIKEKTDIATQNLSSLFKIK